MDRRKLLLVIAATALLVLGPIAPAQARDCDIKALTDGDCPIYGVGPHSVNIGATDSRTGGSAGSGRDVIGPESGKTPRDDADSGPGDPREVRDALGTCQDPVRCGPSEPRVITLEDLASFTPASPSIRMEPGGWMVRGLPSNFIADASINSQDGSLFETPVAVRFTPTSYNWDWGDGSTDTFSVPGETWEELNLPRFSETTTSHVFEERGDTTVGLAVAYSVDASVDGGEWITIEGTVAATTTIDARVLTGKTVLVDGDCAEDPTGPGC